MGLTRLIKMALCNKINQNQYSQKYKSAGERRIAQFLEQSNIAFTYEKPLAVIDQGHTKLFYPDFSLHDFNMIIEYFGINGNPDYIARTNHKIDIYQKNHIPFIPVYPQDFAGNWQEYILNTLRDQSISHIGLLNKIHCRTEQKPRPAF